VISTTTTVGFHLTGQIYHSLSRLATAPKSEHLDLHCMYFTDWTLFMRPNQH